MNGRHAKALRRWARERTFKQPEREYESEKFTRVERQGEKEVQVNTFTVRLVKNCTRAFYRTLKRNHPKGYAHG